MTEAGAVPARLGRGRHGLDGRHRRERHGGLLHPVDLLGVRLGLRPAAHRRAVAEPGRLLLARSQGAEPAGARAASPSTRSTPRWPLFDDGRVMPYGAWAATGSRSSRPPSSPAMAFGMGPAEAVDAPRWLLGRTWGSASVSLKLENRFDPDARSALWKSAGMGRGAAPRLVRHVRPRRHAGARRAQGLGRRRARPALGRRLGRTSDRQGPSMGRGLGNRRC